MTGALGLPANGLTVGTSQLVAGNGRIGIGVASPEGGDLHIAGSGAQLYIEDTGSGTDWQVTQLFMNSNQVQLIANHFNPLATH
jgi:hypothetical protein